MRVHITEKEQALLSKNGFGRHIGGSLRAIRFSRGGPTTSITKRRKPMEGDLSDYPSGAEFWRIERGRGDEESDHDELTQAVFDMILR